MLCYVMSVVMVVVVESTGVSSSSQGRCPSACCIAQCRKEGYSPPSGYFSSTSQLHSPVSTSTAHTRLSSSLPAACEDSPSSDSTSSRCRAVPSSLGSAAGQAADDDIEKTDNAIDNGHTDAADSTDDCHYDIADRLADALEL